MKSRKTAPTDRASSTSKPDMSPPIDIDGSEIQRATIDGEDVSEITIDGQQTAGFVDIPDSGITRYTYDDEDIAGGTLSDVWGGNDASLVGDATSANNGTALDFDGVDDEAAATIPTGTEYSVYTRARVDSTNFNIAIWSFDSSISRAGFKNTLRVEPGPTLIFGHFEDNDGTFYRTTASVSTGTFVDTVATIAEGGEMRLYIGDTQDDSTSVAQLDDSADQYHSAFEAQQGFGDVTLEEQRFYNKQLTDSEVASLVNNGSISG